jgi:hypothetical protein
MWQLWRSNSFIHIEKWHYELFPMAFLKALHATCNSFHGFATSLENLIKENKLCKLTHYKLYCLYTLTDSKRPLH